MPRFLPLSILVALALVAPLALLAACGDDKASSTQPSPGATSLGGDALGSSSGDPAAPAPSTTATTPTSPTGWTPPVVATTSAACGTARPDAVHADGTTPSGRTFHVWGPSGYDPNKTYPVVLVFHGMQTNGADFESWFKMEDYTNNEAFVVYPDAAGADQLWDTGGSTDLAFFDEMVKQLGETYCINPSRVLAFGFSYGGHFVDHLGCARAGYVKAIMVGDGGTGGDRQHCGRLPVLVTTRTNDTNELPSYGRSVVTEWTGLDSCGATAGIKVPQTNTSSGEDMGYCQVQPSCQAPGSLTYCEDTSSFAPTDPPDWNHTVREYYRAYAYQWFKALP